MSGKSKGIYTELLGTRAKISLQMTDEEIERYKATQHGERRGLWEHLGAVGRVSAITYADGYRVALVLDDGSIVESPLNLLRIVDGLCG